MGRQFLSSSALCLIATATSATPSVQLQSDAAAEPPVAGSVVRLQAVVDGSAAPYIFAWDVDGDGHVDRRSAQPSIEAVYPRAGSFVATVTVVAADGTLASDAASLTIRGPQLQVEPVGPYMGWPVTQRGDSAGQMVRITNIGDAAHPAGTAVFVPAAFEAPYSRPAAVMGRGLRLLPELAIGESVDVPLDFSVDHRASCGQPIQIEFLGSFWSGGHTFAPQRVIDRIIADPCTIIPPIGPVVTPPPPPPPIARKTGLYFDQARPGNGLFNYFQRSGYTLSYYPHGPNVERYAGAWYTALPDRTPVWYTLDGELVAGTGILSIRKFRNVAAPDGFAPEHDVVGVAWTSWIDASTVVFAWQLDDGSTGIERMQAGPQIFSGTNHTQSWFDPAESGWGVAIETVVNTPTIEFVGVFVYDAAGEPRWVVGDVLGTQGGHVDLTTHRPHCPSCPWIVDWARDGVAAGDLQLAYPGPASGTLSTAIDLPSGFSGNWRRDNVGIVPIAAPAPAGR